MSKTFRRNRRYRKKTVAKRRRANRSNKRSRNTFFGIKIGGAQIDAAKFIMEDIYSIKTVIFNGITYNNPKIENIIEKHMVTKPEIGKKSITLTRKDNKDEMFTMVIDFYLNQISLSDNVSSPNIKILKDYVYNIDDINFEISKETISINNDKYTFSLNPDAIDLKSPTISSEDDKFEYVAE